ncbi:pathogenesis-related protein STH-2-like [Curcuma longa]|uniref:pathogenesis-related protein STH-2-like n=1 Tax=Curcuma longa TaxID=136217 RepID=UPI003D9E2712
MVASSYTDEVSVNASLSRVWKSTVWDSHNFFPKIMPDFFTKAEIIGDGGVGSIKIFHFGPAGPGGVTKNKVEVLDDVTHRLVYSVIEGPLLGPVLKAHVFDTTFEASGADSCVAKVKISVDTVGDEPLNEEIAKDLREGGVGVLKATEAYLLSNPDAYA